MKYSRFEDLPVWQAAINLKLEAEGKAPFHFIGVGLSNGVPGALSYIDFGKYLLVQGDRNGDREPDFAIKVFGPDKLEAHDFVL